MTLKKLDLLTLLISLFILSGCENPSGIGLDVDPDLALSSDTITLNVETKLLKEDSIATNFTERSLLAYIKDDRFGETTASMALALTLPTSNVSFGTNPQLDSAVLVLPYTAEALYGDSLTYTAEVRQLSEPLYTETQKIYYSNKVWNKGNTTIASKAFRPSYRDSIIIQNIRKGQADTTQKVVPQLRIPLNSTFISQNILSLDSATLSTSKKFADSFNGLYVSLDKTSAPANGGAIAFNTSTAGAARVDIYYRTTNSSGTLDTTVVSFPINGASGAAATEIKWDVSPEVQTELNNTTTNNAKLFLKGLAGTKVKVSFPQSELDRLKAAPFKNLAINRAELLVTAEAPAQSSLLPLSLIRIYKWDIANQPKPLPDEDQTDPRYMGPGYIGGSYNEDKKNYAINITGYIQDIFKGKTPEYGTFLTTFDYLNNTGRLSFPGSVISEGGASTSVNKVKLKIYYTDLK
jgi:hypothetical protein